VATEFDPRAQFVNRSARSAPITTIRRHPEIGQRFHTCGDTGIRGAPCQISPIRRRLVRVVQL
jgi:hypothetical protein